MTRILIFFKVANIRCTGGFWGDKSRGTKIFSIGPFLTLTGPLVKIGGQNLFLNRTSTGTKTCSTDFELVSYAV